MRNNRNHPFEPGIDELGASQSYIKSFSYVFF